MSNSARLMLNIFRKYLAVAILSISSLGTGLTVKVFARDYDVSDTLMNVSSFLVGLAFSCIPLLCGYLEGYTSLHNKKMTPAMRKFMLSAQPTFKWGKRFGMFTSFAGVITGAIVALYGSLGLVEENKMWLRALESNSEGSEIVGQTLLNYSEGYKDAISGTKSLTRNSTMRQADKTMNTKLTDFKELKEKEMQFKQEALNRIKENSENMDELTVSYNAFIGDLLVVTGIQVDSTGAPKNIEVFNRYQKLLCVFLLIFILSGLVLAGDFGGVSNVLFGLFFSDDKMIKKNKGALGDPPKAKRVRISTCREMAQKIKEGATKEELQEYYGFSQRQFYYYLQYIRDVLGQEDSDCANMRWGKIPND